MQKTGIVYSHRECKSGKKAQQMKDPLSLQSEDQYAAKKILDRML